MESSESAEYAKMFSDPPSTGAAVAAAMYGEQEPATGIPVPMVKYQPKPRVPWSSNLCDCCSDVPNCCITLWCPCITFGQIAEIVDKGSNSCGVSGALYALIACVTFCPCCYSCFYRAKMRHQFTLEESPCGDCLVHCCCECCALCQEHRELKSRGFNMAIGWHGNMENQKRAVEMTPATPEQGMSR